MQMLLLITTNKVLTIHGFLKLNLILAVLALILQLIFFTDERRILRKKAIYRIALTTDCMNYNFSLALRNISFSSWVNAL